MVFEHLKVRPGQRATSAWANTLIDILEMLYGLGRRGDPDNPFYELYGYYGYFFNDLYVQGKPVIKDGDPINLYDIFEPAKQKITQAIENSALTQYMGDVREKIVRISIDEYGNIGVRIAEPIDEYGNVRVREEKLDIPLSKLLHGEPVYAQGFGLDETVAQQVELDTKGHMFLEVYAKATTPTNFYLDVSCDNISWINEYMSWKNVTEVKESMWTGFRYIRLRSDPAGSTGDKVDLVLTAK